MRAVQGINKIYKDEAKSVPLSWLIYDLHSGEFFGEYAWLYYDLLSVALVIYSVTGIYMFLKVIGLKKKRNKK